MRALAAKMRVWAASALCVALNIAVVLALPGCGLLDPRVQVAETAPVVAPPAAVAVQNNGSIFQAAGYRPLFEDHRARLTGDTLLVQIVEKVSASQKSNSSVDKSGTIGASVTALPGVRPKAFARATAEGKSNNSFEGKGATESSNDFSGIITVTVRQVLPNGHLLIAGEKQIGVNSNVDVLKFSGQVDPRSIQPGNSVPSAQVANVRLEHKGKGAQAEAQAMGWLSRVFLSVLPI